MDEGSRIVPGLHCPSGATNSALTGSRLRWTLARTAATSSSVLPPSPCSPGLYLALPEAMEAPTDRLIHHRTEALDMPDFRLVHDGNLQAIARTDYL